MLSKICVGKRYTVKLVERKKRSDRRRCGREEKSCEKDSNDRSLWSTILFSSVAVSLGEEKKKKKKKKEHGHGSMDTVITVHVSPKVYQVRAGFWSRLGAFIISWAVWIGVSFIVGPIVYGVPIVIDLALSYRAQDLGKFLSGQVVVDKVTGEPVSMAKMILRYFVKLGLTSVLLVDYLLWPVLGDPVHDALLGTTVVFEMDD